MIEMAWSNYTYLIGERIKVDGEKDAGVVSRITISDQLKVEKTTTQDGKEVKTEEIVEKGLIYVMFKRMREEVYPYPDALIASGEEGPKLIPIVHKR